MIGTTQSHFLAARMCRFRYFICFICFSIARVQFWMDSYCRPQWGCAWGVALLWCERLTVNEKRAHCPCQDSAECLPQWVKHIFSLCQGYCGETGVHKWRSWDFLDGYHFNTSQFWLTLSHNTYHGRRPAFYPSSLIFAICIFGSIQIPRNPLRVILTLSICENAINSI